MSSRGDGLGLALRIKGEGHDISVTIRDDRAKRNYDGLLRKVDKFDKAITKETVLIFDAPGFGKMAERLRGQGYAVLGASMLADQLASDEAFAYGIMEDAGIRVSENAPANSMGTLGWFDGFNFLQPYVHSFDRYRLMNDDLGPEMDCAGALTFACPHDTCRVCQDGLAKLVPILRHHGYSGLISMDTAVVDGVTVGVRIYPCFEYDVFPALMEMFTEPLGDTLAAYARGERGKDFPVKREGYGAALRVSIPPYSDMLDAPEGLPITGLTRSDRQHSYFYDVRLSEDATLETSGGRGSIAAFTGFADTLPLAVQLPLEIAGRVEVLNKSFRTDLPMVFMGCMAEFERASIMPDAVEAVEKVAY